MERKTPKIAAFPLGFHQPTGEGPSHGHRQHPQKFGKDRGCGCGDMLADRPTDTQTDRQTCSCSSQYFATAVAGKVQMQGIYCEAEMYGRPGYLIRHFNANFVYHADCFSRVIPNSHDRRRRDELSKLSSVVASVSAV